MKPVVFDNASDTETRRLGSAMSKRSAGPRRKRYRSKNIADSSCVPGIAIIKNNQ